MQNKGSPWLYANQLNIILIVAYRLALSGCCTFLEYYFITWLAYRLHLYDSPE
jgi:hypothetical protein